MRESIKLIVSRPYFPEKMHQVDNSDGGYCFLYLSQWNWCCVLFYTNEMIVVVCFLSALSRDRVYRFCWDGPRTAVPFIKSLTCCFHPMALSTTNVCLSVVRYVKVVKIIYEIHISRIYNT